jgi:hypothetical protein
VDQNGGVGWKHLRPTLMAARAHVEVDLVAGY